MMTNKYKTIQEYVEETDKTSIGKILILSTYDIDAMIKSGVFRLEGRQVWYADTLVFPQVPVEFPGNPKLIEIKQVKAPE